MSAEVIQLPVARPADGLARETVEALFRDHRENVFRYLRAFTGDEEEALDLTALTFERALRQLASQGGELGLGWLIRTARNAAIDAARHRRGINRAVARLASAPIQPSTEEAAIGAERARELLAAVAHLPGAQRDAIALRYSTELTVGEIARLVGKTEAATQKLIGRALARLKEMLDDQA